MKSLILQPVLKPDTMKLSEAYEVLDDVKRTICGVTVHVPKFFQYDGASIPAIAWQIIGTPFNPRFMIASVFHDWLYHTHQVPRAAADKLHYDILKEDGVIEWKAAAMNYAVRRFGEPYWANKTSDNRYICHLTRRIVEDGRDPSHYGLPPK
jgi:hypothetical protein